VTASLVAFAFVFAPVQDDRATILDGVESWYQVVQDGRNRGYVHEKLERVKSQWSYTYVVDFILDAKDPKDASRTVDLFEYRSVEARLDEDLAPTALKAAVEAGGRRIDYSIAAEGEKRSLTIGDRIEALPSEMDFHTLPTLLFYSMRQNGLLAKEGRRSVRLLVPRAEGRIDAEVTFEVGAPVRKEVLRKSGALTPVTFLKPPPAARSEVQWTEALVDKHGRLVEIGMRGGARVVLVEDDLAAFKKAVNLHRSTRRDPMDKKEAMNGGRTTPFPDEDRLRVTADTLMSTLSDAQKNLEPLRVLKANGSSEEIAKAYFELLQQWKAIRDRAAALGKPEVVAQADAVRAGAEEIWDGAAQALQAARLSSVKAIEAFDRMDLADLERNVKSLREAASRIELELRPELSEVIQMAAKAEPMLVRCRTRVDLARKPVLVTAIVIAAVDEPVSIEVGAGVRQNVRFMRDRSSAAINGKTYQVGDRVDELGIRLEKVSTHSVTVSLRGELREIPLGPR
jgi:hypothetical protein